MKRLYIGLIFCAALFSCRREDAAVPVPQAEPQEAAAIAVLQAGEYPLWFQLGRQGPVLLDSIDDAVFSTALVPWPLALHIRVILARGNEVLMAVNRDGFLRFAPWEGEAPDAGQAGTGLYRYSGGEFWQSYTLASFVFYGDKPAALLYRDDRFLDSDAPPPAPRVWTFSPQSPVPSALDIDALNRFPAEEGWDIDALRYAADGFWYYRAVRRNAPENEILFFRSPDLSKEGEPVSLGVFQNSALPEPLSASPELLRSVLVALDVPQGGTVSLLSPGFRGARYFARNAGGPVNVLACAPRDGEASRILAIDTAGRGLYARSRTDAPPDFSPLALPELPANFVYTGIAVSGETLIASWEEQENFYTGAAGFMILKLPE